MQRIDLSADDPDAVDAMLQFCYQLDYVDKFLPGLSSAGYTIYTLTPHIDIYLLAERYSIPGLKQLAVEKFENRASVLSRVEVNKEKFFQSIRIIYASTRSCEDDLRKVAVRLCADHAEPIYFARREGRRQGSLSLWTIYLHFGSTSSRSLRLG